MEALCGLRAGGCVCMYAVRLMEQDREVDYRGDYNFLVTLWAPLHPLHACVCMRACYSHVYLSIAHMTLSYYSKTAGSVTHHLLRIQGHREKRITFGSRFRWVLPLDSNYAAFTWTKDVLVIWTTKNVSGWSFGMGACDGGFGNAFRRIGKGKKRGS